MVDDIRTFIENGLNVYNIDPKYVSKLPKCLHCVKEIKTPKRPSLKPPFPRRKAEGLYLPARPSVYHLPPLMRTFKRSTKKGQSGTKKLLPKRPKNSFTKPFEKPFSLQLEVKENLGSTRKLGDYGVYKASRRNFEKVETSEEEIIKAVQDYSFNKI